VVISILSAGTKIKASLLVFLMPLVGLLAIKLDLLSLLVSTKFRWSDSSAMLVCRWRYKMKMSLSEKSLLMTNDLVT